MWQGGGGDQEVDAASLEVSVGGEDENPASDSLRGGFGEEVIGVSLEDFTGGDGTRDFFDEAVEVNYADQVESSAGKDASQTAP